MPDLPQQILLHLLLDLLIQLDPRARPRPRRLAGAFTGAFLLLLEVLKRLVDLLLGGLVDLLDEIGETVYVLTRRVLHARNLLSLQDLLTAATSWHLESI